MHQGGHVGVGRRSRRGRGGVTWLWKGRCLGLCATGGAVAGCAARKRGCAVGRGVAAQAVPPRGVQRGG
eukprot:4401796-Prymnesium_polylepis.1